MSFDGNPGEGESTALPIVMRRDFPPRTICAPPVLAEELRARLQKTYGEFFIRTNDADEVQVSTDMYELARPLFRTKPR